MALFGALHMVVHICSEKIYTSCVLYTLNNSEE